MGLLVLVQESVNGRKSHEGLPVGGVVRGLPEVRPEAVIFSIWKLTKTGLALVSSVVGALQYTFVRVGDHDACGTLGAASSGLGVAELAQATVLESAKSSVRRYVVSDLEICVRGSIRNV